MNSEQTQFRSRVARHSALADPARLRIMDLLAVGDAAPVELQAALGITSNLLAHHVAVLADAGLVTRTRSHADRRRTYLHVAPDALDDLLPSARIAVRRVVFVCTGNSARSQIAAALWREASTIPVASAGTHPAPAIEPAALSAAGRHGLTLTAAVPRAIGDVVTDEDLVVTVCDNAHEELGGAGRLHWSVPDPVAAGTDAAFDAAVEELARRVHTLAQHATAA
ncbi:MAG: ArsR family transcriptional regulator [Cellulomonas sp. 73-92]|uniref:arsenate reductase/protein-tyrosine-phosphatase family protein n=1 Tax=Cellulomonas sp. 73-92 TaxID=1895740 RepID=UPI0009284CF1|nr:helix-turn-helix domain-containing protein [Cellulomonas sp. 73-92]OJV75014.1 MAG: ArsR family transcriptional regulator [Cellulomonas sp. 73-92]